MTRSNVAKTTYLFVDPNRGSHDVNVNHAWVGSTPGCCGTGAVTSVAWSDDDVPLRSVHKPACFRLNNGDFSPA